MDPATAQQLGFCNPGISLTARARAEPRKSGKLLSKIGCLAEDVGENSYCGNNNQDSATLLLLLKRSQKLVVVTKESSPRHHYLFPTSHSAVARPLSTNQTNAQNCKARVSGPHRQSELLSHLFRAASLSEGAAANQGQHKVTAGASSPAQTGALSGSIA